MPDPTSRPHITAHDADPVVVTAADDRFAMPLAVTIRSVLDHLSPDRKLRLFVLDGGIRAENARRMVDSWPADRFELHWRRVDASALEGLPESGHINLISYYRILLPQILPPAIGKALYLDSDLLVRTDLGRLWDTPLETNYCAAVQECWTPFVDSSHALGNHPARAHLGGNPIPNYRELGLRPDAAYFNAGVLLIDVDGWRHDNLPARFLECLEVNREHVCWHDQYALNVVLAGRWQAADLRWNQGTQIFNYPSWAESPFDQQTFSALRDDPYIVHFNTAVKPWHARSEHPFRAEFYACLDRTRWAGWRPSRGQQMLAALNKQERRLRHARKWLSRRASELLARRAA